MGEILGDVLIGFILMAAVAVLYLPVYFVLRKKVCFVRQMSFLLLAGCCLIILLATVLISVILGLTDGQDVLGVRMDINLIPFRWITEEWAMGREKMLSQVAANVVMFIPFGFILPAALPKFRGFLRTMFCAAGFSFLIEFVQYFIGRSSDIDDFLQNTAGGVIGYLIFLLFSKLFQRRKVWKKFTGRLS
ncbi:VanZ family protein [Ruminococcus sp. OA3]|uniref:VanZ family protein n=1 Tax=Ruminococcus sp. OA3 TaxID=2914164 RepID=UPI001F05F427|nr:VanZ family protein [Ruminococcus sp. OA3]MCH1982536.1 VanZ family protein [Ruminococcus sp. OA3]